MKNIKFALLVIAAFVVVGCSNTKDIEYNVIELDYMEHSFILFQSLKGNISAIHSPSCKCMIK